LLKAAVFGHQVANDVLHLDHLDLKPPMVSQSLAQDRLKLTDPSLSFDQLTSQPLVLHDDLGGLSHRSHCYQGRWTQHHDTIVSCARETGVTTA
jgi:hypothetical protein